MQHVEMHCAELNNGLFIILGLHSYMKNFYTSTFKSENIAKKQDYFL